MLNETTDWRRLYATAAGIGLGMGLLLALDLLPSAPAWPSEWGIRSRSVLVTVLLPIAGGSVVGVLLAGVAHLGVRHQLNRASHRRRIDQLSR